MTERSRPVEGAANDLVDGRSTLNRTRLIGATVENRLSATLERLMHGEIGLHELTPSLAAFYHLGHAHGVESMRPAVEQALADAARYYERWCNPGKVLDETQRQRIDEAAEDHWQQFLDGGPL